MKAVTQLGYGAPDQVLRITDVERPTVGHDAVLVQVRATTVTRGHAIAVRGREYRFTRLFTGLLRPRQSITGSEFAGDVVEVGAAVTAFRIGDAVFGIANGAHAEFVVVPERGVIAHMPVGISYDQAAAIPDGALLALTCLRPGYPLRGKQVLVYGATGSIGSAAVQLLAHHFGAIVTAFCDGAHLDLVRSLGAQAVFDRTRVDVTRTGRTYDVIFDAVGRHSFRRCWRALEPYGVYITVDLGFLHHVPLLALLTRIVGGRRVALGINRYRQDELLVVTRLVETGHYRPVIDRTSTLDDIVDATRYVETGQKTGNVVLRVGQGQTVEQTQATSLPSTVRLSHDVGESAAVHREQELSTA